MAEAIISQHNIIRLRQSKVTKQVKVITDSEE